MRIPTRQSLRAAMFRWLLGHSQGEDLARYVPPLTLWLSHYACINEAWIKPEVYRLFQQHGFHLVRNHYYGVLPDTRDLPDSWWAEPAYQSAYDLIPKLEDMDGLFQRVMNWSPDLANLPRDPTGGFYWNNPMFPPLDALVLYGMIREYRPRQLLEIGSGFSTEIALLAAQKTQTAIHCIEPHPAAQLLTHRSQLQELTQAPLQDVDLKVFDRLQANDFLFIDTTHTVKIRSDVNYLVFRILPRLASGVIIHFHDIFLPHEYPHRWYDEISIFWNEQYLLLAYLMENPGLQLLLPNYALSLRHKDQLRERLKDFDIWNITENLGGASGASFWLRKR